MKEIIKEISALYETIEKKDKQLDTAIEFNAQETARLSGLKFDLTEKAERLTKREGSVAHIESVTKLKTETLALQDQHAKDLTALRQERSQFSEYSENEQESIRVRKEDVTFREGALKTAQEKLAKDQKQLEEDRKTMRAKIIEELSNFKG